MPRDPRTYITVHDGMPDHPKIEGLSDQAFRLLITTWCWCSRNLTDGRIPATSWNKRGTPRARKELLNAGLVEHRDDHFFCHDYTEHQRTAEEVEKLRSKRAEAGKLGGLAKAEAQREASKALASASPLAKQTSGKNVAESETETDKEKSVPRKRGHRLPDGWLPDAEVRRKMADEYPHVDLRLAHEKFTDYWTEQPGQRGVKLDWNGTWRNWIRSEAERTPTGRAARSNGHTPAGPPAEILGDIAAMTEWYDKQATKEAS